MRKNFRHEYKYLISREAAQLLKLRLPHIMKRDVHAGQDGTYTIRSLYFDDQAFSAFYEKASGIDNRTKYRIRCYNYDYSFFNLERKEKKGDLTRKRGETISLEDVKALQRCEVNRSEENAGTLLEELQMKCADGLHPVVLVDYDRTAFTCGSGNVRITLDENLRTIPYRGDIFAGHNAMVPVMEPDEVILEVKFDDFLPGYLSECLADIPKAPQAVSKFALCLNIT